MALLHPQSVSVIKSELDLFTIPPTQVQVERGYWVQYQPTINIPNSGPIQFNIAGSGEEYIDLSDILLQTKVRIVGGAGRNDVGPINLFLHSLFSHVEVSLNSQCITPPNHTYAYKSYMETLLNYSKEGKKSRLTSELYYKDTARYMDDAKCNEDKEPGNEGLRKRWSLTAGAKVVDMIGPLHLDFFNQERCLLNDVDIRINLTRSNPKFVLMTPTEVDAQIIVLEAILHVRKMKISPAVMNAHSLALQKTSAKYPINRSDVRYFTIPKGSSNMNHDVITGKLPQRIIIGLVDSEAYAGSYTKNPYNFQHFGLNGITVHVDGYQFPSTQLKPNFKEGSYMRSFYSLFQGLENVHSDRGCDINREEYPNGYTLWVFDLTPDLTHGNVFQLSRQGNLRLELQFEKGLETTINCLVYAEFQNIIEIDRNRQVILDYAD